MPPVNDVSWTRQSRHRRHATEPRTKTGAPSGVLRGSTNTHGSREARSLENGTAARQLTQLPPTSRRRGRRTAGMCGMADMGRASRDGRPPAGRRVTVRWRPMPRVSPLSTGDVDTAGHTEVGTHVMIAFGIITCQTRSGTPGRSRGRRCKAGPSARRRGARLPHKSLPPVRRRGITSHETWPSMKKINFRNRPGCSGAGPHVSLSAQGGARPEDRRGGRARLAGPVPQVLRRSPQRWPARARMSPAAGATPVRLVRRGR